jgi:hypothetical protein
MRIRSNKILCSLRYPYAWEKFLASMAKKKKTTVSKIIGNILEKKFRYTKIGKSEADELAT